MVTVYSSPHLYSSFKQSPGSKHTIILFNTYTAKPVCWNGCISDSYCSIKPLCSGMGEVVPARTSPTLLPHPLALCCDYPVSKCLSASIVVTSTVRVKPSFMYHCIMKTICIASTATHLVKCYNYMDNFV